MVDPSKQNLYTVSVGVGGAGGGEGGNLMSNLKSLFSVLRTRRTKLFAYGFIFTFVAFTAFLAFSPSANSASPWFNNIFSLSTASDSTNFDSSGTSQFSSLFSYLFPNSSQPILQTEPNTTRSNSNNTTDQTHNLKQSHFNETIGKFNQTINTPTKTSTRDSSSSKNQTVKGVTEQNRVSNETVKGVAEQNSVSNFPDSSFPKIQTVKGVTEQNRVSNSTDSSSPKNQTVKGVTELNRVSNFTDSSKNLTVKGIGITEQNRGSSYTNSTVKGVTEENRVSNYTVSLPRKNNTTSAGNSTKGENTKNEKKATSNSLMHCDIFDGKWVKDDSYPLYLPGSCPHIDEQFNCFINGRPDRDFQKLRWQPKGCNIPRLNGRDMLELLRGKRLVFVGDSLNRNMWESLVCVLRNSVSDKSKVYEASGRREFRTDNSYLFIFKDYNCTVEFFRSPFLVQEWEMPETNGSKKETLRLDLVEKSSSKYKNADIIVFNTGHWWTHEKTSKGKDYYQEGSHVYGELNVVEAFRKALTTWAKWVDVNINPKKTLVFFRGYSASHFSGGQWNSGGQCDDETEPIKNDTYLSVYPPKMRVLESVLHGMKMPVSYLNITRMTDYRKDAHPSIYRKQNVPEEERRSPLRYQDCSHWCLPGVPDSWNELLYAKIKQNRRKQQQQQKQQQQKQPKRS